MARSEYGKGLWQINGPRALAWLRATVPQRHSLRGLPEECVATLHLPVGSRRLVDWLGSTARDDWQAIKRTLGAGNGHGAPPVFVSGGAPPDQPPAALTTGAFAGSLRDFVLSEKRAACPVCRLPEDIRKQLHDDRVKPDVKLRFVASKCGVTLTRQDVDAHSRERHEQ